MRKIVFEEFFEILKKSSWWKEISFSGEVEEVKSAFNIFKSFTSMPAPGLSRTVDIELACDIAGEGGRKIFELGRRYENDSQQKKALHEFQKSMEETAGSCGIPISFCKK